MSSRVTRNFPLLVQAPVLFVGQPLYENFLYFMSRVFSCWHLKLSRPFTRGRDSYRVCIRCGMHRAFDVEAWKSTGRFYSPSVERRIN